MTIWVGSDWHWHHRNIAKFCPKTRGKWGPADRGMTDTELSKMNEDLIELWNSQVKNGDRVIFVGDFSFARTFEEVENVFSRLNGQIELCEGNHDHEQTRKQKWANVYKHKSIMVGKQKIVIDHYPSIEWDGFHNGSIQLFGHVHGRPVLPRKWKTMDVGFDAIERLISIDEVIAKMEKKENYIINIWDL